MIQVLDKYGNTSTDDGRVVIIDKFGNVKKPVVPTGTVTSIVTASPLTGGPITTTGTIGITQATTSTDGYLSSTDWNTFNSKFNLPTLTNGSVLFSNGTTITENNTNFFWDNTTNTLILNKPSVQGASLTANGIISAGAISLVPANNTISIGTITAATTSGSGIFYGSSQNVLHLRTLSITRLYINNLGDIGIGTTAPSVTSKVNIDLGTYSGTKDGIAIDGNCTGNPGNTGVRFSLLNTSGNITGFIKAVRASGSSYVGMQISSQSRDGIAFLTDTVTATEKMRLTANGNLLLGTTSDNSSKLNVQGTITASSAIARGVSFNNTLVAAANNDVLIGLDVNPIFTNGSFTGVSNYAIRIPNGIPIIGLGITGLNLPLISAAGSGTITLGGTFSGNTPAIRIQGSNIVFANASTTFGAFFTGTGNLALQNGGGFTDNLARLQVGGSITASSSIARGVSFTPTLVAAANSDTLVGLDIAPTFTNGAFTGVTNAAIRLTGNVSLTADNTFLLGSGGNNFATIRSRYFVATTGTGVFGTIGSYDTWIQSNGTPGLVMFNSTRNVAIQNGGTFTDDGVNRLQVNGPTKLNGLQTFQGTTASDTAPLGAELATTATGTNWTGTSFATGYTHTIGSTVALVSTLAAVIGTYYQIAYTITGRTAGSIAINYGGTGTSGITATGATGPMATATTALNIVPTTDFDGVLVLSIKTIGTSSATTSFTNSAGIVTNELRVSSSNSNVFLGLNAGRRNTTSTNNTFIGTNTGTSNTTGRTNTFIGLASGYANTTGYDNLFVGVSAGYNNTIGTGNTFIGGYGAGLSNTTAVNNTYIGAVAGQNNTTGNNNVLVGVSSGRFISTGTTLATILTNSIMLGFNTRPLADNQTNQIVIGYAAVGLGSNTTVLGNSSTVTTAIYGNLLVGTTTTNGSKLNIQGTVTAASAIARGQFLAPTLVASANNDTLVGLDIAPMFTNGAFTGVKNYWLQLQGNGSINGTNQINILRNGSGILVATSLETNLSSTGTVTPLKLSLSSGALTMGQFMPTTGNFILQNSGTFTDVTSSRLTINSTTQGVLLPRMTTAEVNAIVSPVQGLTVFNTDLDTLCFYTTSWQKVTSTTM